MSPQWVVPCKRGHTPLLRRRPAPAYEGVGLPAPEQPVYAGVDGGGGSIGDLDQLVVIGLELGIDNRYGGGLEYGGPKAVWSASNHLKSEVLTL